MFLPQPMPHPGMPVAAPPPMPRQMVPQQQQQAGGYVPPRLTPPRTATPRPADSRPAPRTARGARPAEPARAAVVIPTPEELGIAPANGAPKSRSVLDWSATRRRMDELGVTSFHLEPAGGGARFTCWVGGEKVQADGATEAEAVSLCLERARRHTANRR